MSCVDLFKEKQPRVAEAFRDLMEATFVDGALPIKVKELIALGVGLAVNCPECIRGHARRAIKAGATEQEIVEAIAATLSCLGCPTFPRSEIVFQVLKEEKALRRDIQK